MTPSRLACLLAASSVAQACGGTNVAQLRPRAVEGKPAAEQCSVLEESRSVWFADAKPDDVENIEALMRRGTVVIASNCQGSRLLPNCRLSGKYRYMGLSQRERVVQLTNRDEVTSNLAYAHGEHARDFELDPGHALDVASIVVGRMSSPRRFVNAADLSGDCGEATHAILDIDVGASALLPGRTGRLRSVPDAFEAAVDESLRLPGERFVNVMGDRDACATANPNDPQAPLDCQSPIRLHMTRVGATSKPLVAELAPAPAAASKVVSSLYEKACFEGNVEGCLRLGIVLETSSQAPEDWARASGLYERACDHGSQPACDALTRLYRSQKAQTEPLRRAKQLYVDGCYGAEPSACASLPVLIALPAMQDPSRRALELDVAHRRSIYAHNCGNASPDRCLPLLLEEEKSCASGDGEECFILAFAYYGLADYEDKSLPRDLDRAAHLFERACDSGVVEACGNLGLMLSMGDVFPTDEKRGAALKEKSCNAGYYQSCVSFAYDLEEGKGIPKDTRRAIELFKRECRDGCGRSCHHLGWSYLLGDGAVKNIQEGIRHIKNSCELTCSLDPNACDSYAFIQLNGIGIRPSEKSALLSFEETCKSGVEESCMLAGFMHLFGRGTPKNQPKASALFKAGCNAERIASWEEVCSRPSPQPEECAVTGLIWHTGACGEVNRERASGLLARGCHDGWSWACRTLKEYDRAEAGKASH